eukprot:2582442-Pleurochrysis_carterae.AAC.7
MRPASFYADNRGKQTILASRQSCQHQAPARMKFIRAVRFWKHAVTGARSRCSQKFSPSLNEIGGGTSRNNGGLWLSDRTVCSHRLEHPVLWQARVCSLASTRRRSCL